MDNLKQYVEDHYQTKLINMLYDLAEKSSEKQEIIINTSVGSVIIKIN